MLAIFVLIVLAQFVFCRKFRFTVLFDNCLSELFQIYQMFFCANCTYFLFPIKTQRVSKFWLNLYFISIKKTSFYVLFFKICNQKDLITKICSVKPLTRLLIFHLHNCSAFKILNFDLTQHTVKILNGFFKIQTMSARFRIP